MSWEPIDITTPAAWQAFTACRVGSTTIGCAAAFSWHALYFGIQIIGNGPSDARGIGFAIGPIWIGFAILRPKGGHA